ncbi:hypothetical protein AGMMS49992_31720 [Clostridia bacterium]|nr:hypothetical protein AGMMS49992_31720 [Clostridia bacterium]
MVVSRLVAYKKIDIVVEAFNQLEVPLVVIGRGEESEKLKSISKKNISFLGECSDETVRDYLQRCKALIFPGEEDLGLTPIEAQACGKPVIAFGLGGVLETVIANRTGLFFYKSTKESLIDAVTRFSSHELKRF